MTAQIFRALHHGDKPFVVPNPWDVGSARVLASMGFPALATTSAGMAFSMGRIEGTVPSAHVLDHCRTIVSATPLPVSADLERGFGDSPESVAETIRAAAATGLAGGSIEDHTGNRDAPVYDHTLAVERIIAGVEAARTLSRDFVLTARCESLLWCETRLDPVIARLQAFEAAGADVLYAPGLPDLDAIRTVCAAVTRPVNVVMGLPGRTFTLDQLAEAGVARISVGSAFFRVAYGAFIGAVRDIRDTGHFDKTAQGIGFAELESHLAPFTEA
ncbi:isocitrate lyase/PEP mutase family protein [Roseovarius sp.]|uniref:isocitrate lyase/PEP mutase family protein n=1 Tax=Roseovarius sp. TaxID=1486281 RepID=UPI003B59FD56